jgi:hypothetical protein
VRGEHRFRPADMQRVAGHRDRILGRCGELVPIVQFYNGVLKRSSGGKSRTAITRASWSRRSRLSTRGLSPYTNVRATMDIAEIDVGRSIFEYGQTYVALSR